MVLRGRGFFARAQVVDGADILFLPEAMMREHGRVFARVLVLVGLLGAGFALGYFQRHDASVDGNAFAAAGKAAAQNAPGASAGGDTHMRQSPGFAVDRRGNDFGLGENHASRLLTYPPAPAGARTPFDLWRYAGRDASSFGNATLGLPWNDWLAQCQKQKPKLMEECQAYMASRFNFSGRAIRGVMMTGGKAVMAGPISVLPKGIASYEELAALSPDAISSRDVFPYKPLAHPLQSTAHMVFPAQWTKYHPEHIRMDVDHDIPDGDLPEFPPPLFLTTHKELGDVTKGREVTFGNYYEIFNGLLTGEQMEGLKELLRPTATTWFNHTEHRVTVAPSAGVSCFSCHVNGHTNGAFEIAPDSRPNPARLRVDTPTMRGNYNLMQLSSKRSIRSMDHFSEVEEYFDGDPGALGQPIGLANRQRQLTNRMGDFNALIDCPPAPKLGPLMKLIAAKSTPQELRGEALFHGKAQCATCHYGPQFVDDYMHDLRVERFYKGRPEGPIKTFPLRAIKDSPPYLHDGRCMTLHDAVEFFNIVLELKLTKDEKEDLVAYLVCL
jgi:cytochrome c peroxidase